MCLYIAWIKAPEVWLVGFLFFRFTTEMLEEA